MHGFWDLNIGNLLTLGVLLASFWAAHWSNVNRIKQSESRMTSLETKVCLLYEWFRSKVIKTESGD